ncbi:unnamed protein product, partial [Mesorhabditis spiculigera]
MEMPEQRDSKINTYAILIWILFGTIGFVLSTYAFVLLYRKKALSLGSKLFLLSSCYIRATQSLFCFFKAHCVMTMWCISLRRAPFSGFLFNNFISNYHQGVADTLRWLTAGLALNRFFAVYFDGYFYKTVEKTALFQITLSFFIPVAMRPAQLALAILYVWNPVFWEIIDIQEIVISYLYWVTFVVDLMTFWKIRKMDLQLRRRCGLQGTKAVALIEQSDEKEQASPGKKGGDLRLLKLMLAEWLLNLWKLALPVLVHVIHDWNYISVARVLVNDVPTYLEYIVHM